MRIVGGTHRGRRLPARLPPGVRPTSDRVREAIFDILGSMGGVQGTSVIDLFCGSGAMGIEAASRGAGSVTFVDCDSRAIEAVRENLAYLGITIERNSGFVGSLELAASLPAPGLSGRVDPGRNPGLDPERDAGRVAAVAISGDVLCRRLPEWISDTSGFDVAFCDPPYDFDDWVRLLDHLKANVAILESNRPIDAPLGWNVDKTRRYGGTLVTVARSTSTRSLLFDSATRR